MSYPICVGETAVDLPPLPVLPWSVILPHQERAKLNHDQTLERLAERGGLSVCEAVAILEERRWRRMDPKEAILRLTEIIQERL